MFILVSWTVANRVQINTNQYIGVMEDATICSIVLWLYQLEPLVLYVGLDRATYHEAYMVNSLPAVE